MVWARACGFFLRYCNITRQYSKPDVYGFTIFSSNIAVSHTGTNFAAYARAISYNHWQIKHNHMTSCNNDDVYVSTVAARHTTRHHLSMHHCKTTPSILLLEWLFELIQRNQTLVLTSWRSSRHCKRRCEDVLISWRIMAHRKRRHVLFTW